MCKINYHKRIMHCLLKKTKPMKCQEISLELLTLSELVLKIIHTYLQ